MAGPAFGPGAAGAAGVYVGCMYTEYLNGPVAAAGEADADSAGITGHGLSFLVGRVSYTFGLQVWGCRSPLSADAQHTP